MGLVTETIVKHTPSVVCTDGSSSSPFEETLSFDKSIYRLLSMQDDMKVLPALGRVRTEFDRFIEQAELKTASLGYNTAFDSLDTYLGTIGVSNDIC